MLDVREESVRVQLAALYLLEAALPLGGEQRRAQGFGQHGYERFANVGRHELALDALGEAAVYELLNSRRARGGCAKATTLCVGRCFFRARALHCGEQRVLGECVGRHGMALFDARGVDGYGRALAKFGQRRPIWRDSVRTPAEIDDTSALSPEDVIAALGFDLCFGVNERLGNGAQQLPADEPQNSGLSLGQCGEIGASGAQRGYNGVVVGDARAVADRISVDARGRVRAQQLRRDARQLRHLCCHAVRQIPAVRARVCHELLLVQRLQIVQRLLCREAQLSVGLALERSQIV